MSASEPAPDSPDPQKAPKTTPLARVVKKNGSFILIINSRALGTDSINTQKPSSSNLISDRSNQPAGSSPEIQRTSIKRKAVSQPASLVYQREDLQRVRLSTAESPRKRAKSVNTPGLLPEQSSSSTTSHPSRKGSVTPSASTTQTTPDVPDSTKANSSARDSAAQGGFGKGTRVVPDGSSHPPPLNRSTSAFSAWGRDYLFPGKYIDQESGETVTPSDPGLTPEDTRQTASYFGHHPPRNP